MIRQQLKVGRLQLEDSWIQKCTVFIYERVDIAVVLQHVLYAYWNTHINVHLAIYPILTPLEQPIL